MNMNTLSKLYIFDKTLIYKNPLEELKELLNENEKIKIISEPQYVSKAFQIAKELNEEGFATLDEELKVERNFKDKKNKTKISFSIKRKPELNNFLIGKNYFNKNVFEEIKNYLKNHDKVTIVANNEEVGAAFKVAKELVEQGIASYDEELKLGRNFKEGQGKTKVFISLKRKPIIKEYIVKKNEDCASIIDSVKKLLINNRRINIISTPLEESTAFKAAKSLITQGLAIYDEEAKIQRDLKINKCKTKSCISMKRSDHFKVGKSLNNIAIKNELKDKSSKAIVESSENLDKKGKNIVTSNKEPEYEIEKKSTHKTIIKELREVFKTNDRIILVTSAENVGNTFMAIKILYEEGLILLNDELKIRRNFKAKNSKTKVLISLRKKIKNNIINIDA